MAEVEDEKYSTIKRNLIEILTDRGKEILLPILIEQAEILTDIHILVNLYINFLVFHSKTKKEPVPTVDESFVIRVYHQLSTNPDHIAEKQKKSIVLLPRFAELLNKHGFDKKDYKRLSPNCM